MSKPPMKTCAAMAALLSVSMAAAQTTAGTVVTPAPISPTTISTTATISSPGQTRVADKVAAPFVTLAGSRENAIALAAALRNGSTATFSYTSMAVDGSTTTTIVTITPPTKPMGWGNVSHSLALAQFALNQTGISNPTGAQLQVALQGGSFTTADGRTVTLAGVLRQRADGMGWGRIAQSYGTTMGAVNRGTKAPATAVATTTTPVVPKSASGVTAPKVASAQGAATARGLTTAAGAAAGTGQGAKGLTTAAGATSRASSSGIVSASGSARGNGNANGRGVVTASGSGAGVTLGLGASRGTSSGVVTGAGNAGHVVNADPSHGAGSGVGQGKGKGG